MSKYKPLLQTLDQAVAEATIADLPDLIGIAERTSAMAHLRLRLSAADTKESDRVIGTEEVASIIGLSASWVEKHPHVLPQRVSVNGNPRWRKSDIERWIKTRPLYGKPS